MNVNRMITPYKKTPMSNKKNKFIVIHYVGGVSSAKNNCIYYNRKDARDASAHYFVDDTGIHQLVDDKDAAWHCGAKSYKHKECRNSNSIGIEMCLKKDGNGRLYVTDKTISIVGELVRELMKKYGISESNVIRHYDVTGKSCPNCNGLLNDATWKTFRSKLCKNVIADTKMIKEDGLWGKDTTKLAQKVFNTVVDGIVSNQYKCYKDENKGLLSSTFEWENKPAKNGSVLIKGIQNKIGVKQDGFVGPGTIKAMQKWLGTGQDGVCDNPSAMVKAFQKWLNKQV